MRELGCYKELSNEEYHSDKDFISRSALMDFAISPYTYWAKHRNPDRPKKDATRQMILGSAFHTMILEPHLFNEHYTLIPPKVLLKDVGKAEYDIYKSKIAEIKNTSKIILTHEEYHNLKNMLDRCILNDNAIELRRNSRIENSFFWQDAQSGLLLKSRPDILQENIIIDLKTTSDASPRAFQNEMVKYGYHIQMAMIRDAVEACEGRRISNFINIVIETKYPYNMAIYLVDESAIDEGEKKYKSLCLDLAECIKNNEYPDYGIQTISLPKWAI